MAEDKISAINSKNTHNVNKGESNSPTSYNRSDWLQKQWEQGATVWDIPCGGGGYNQ